MIVYIATVDAEFNEVQVFASRERAEALVIDAARSSAAQFEDEFDGTYETAVEFLEGAGHWSPGVIEREVL